MESTQFSVPGGHPACLLTHFGAYLRCLGLKQGPADGRLCNVFIKDSISGYAVSIYTHLLYIQTRFLMAVCPRRRPWTEQLLSWLKGKYHPLLSSDTNLFISCIWFGLHTDICSEPRNIPSIMHCKFQCKLTFCLHILCLQILFCNVSWS